MDPPPSPPSVRQLSRKNYSGRFHHIDLTGTNSSRSLLKRSGSGPVGGTERVNLDSKGSDRKAPAVGVSVSVSGGEGGGKGGGRGMEMEMLGAYSQVQQQEEEKTKDDDEGHGDDGEADSDHEAPEKEKEKEEKADGTVVC
jgi:hypothetical protein